MKDMKEAYKPFVGILLVAACLAALVGVSTWREAQEIVPWRTDFVAAEQEARRSHKPVFLYLTASWCGPCQDLKRTLWADQDVEAALRDYVPVKVDVDQNPGVAADYLRTPANLDGGIPAFRVLDEQGRVTREAVARCRRGNSSIGSRGSDHGGGDVRRRTPGTQVPPTPPRKQLAVERTPSAWVASRRTALLPLSRYSGRG